MLVLARVGKRNFADVLPVLIQCFEQWRLACSLSLNDFPSASVCVCVCLRVNETRYFQAPTEEFCDLPQWLHSCVSSSFRLIQAIATTTTSIGVSFFQPM